jgi:2-methylcitrate dehydratase PrpD
MSNPLLLLAAEAHRWRTRPIDAETARSVRFALLDWLGTTVAGAQQPPATDIARALAPFRGNGKALSIVDGFVGSPRHAALVNGTASHVVEFDDIFRDGGYHPGSPTIAAALAIAQQQAASLDELHRAIVAGYEVGCRIALAVQPSHYRFWHTTATVGAIGAAVSAALLLDGDEAAIAQAMAIATSFASGHQENLQGSGTVKALHAGHAAEAGLLAAYAARAGVSASLSSLDSATGFAASMSGSTGDWATATGGLGEWTPINLMTTKYHGCCGHIFPALDGLAQMRAEHGFDAADVASIHVDGYEATKAMCDRMVVNSARDARFSVQYCLAALMTMGKVRLEAFFEAALQDSAIRQLMPRITVATSPAAVEVYPRRRMADVSVVLNDGRRFKVSRTTRKGDPEDPLSETEMLDKFRELAGTGMAQDAVARLAQQVLEGLTLPDLGAATKTV